MAQSLSWSHVADSTRVAIFTVRKLGNSAFHRRPLKKGFVINTQRILLIQGHSDASEPHLCHAHALSYTKGAEDVGHTLRQVDVAHLDFPLLRSQKDFETGSVPASLKPVQDDIVWAEHIVSFFPLWAGNMPALLKGFIEQIYRPAFTGASASHFAEKRLSVR